MLPAIRIPNKRAEGVRKMKRPDLLVLVAIWEFISAFGALIGIAAIIVFAIPDSLGWYHMIQAGYQMGNIGAIFGLSVGILVLLGFMGVSIAGGIGLLTGREWGRIMSIVHAVLSLFWFPIGTVIGVLAIIYLTKPAVRDYFTSGSQ
jgi:hypothetical protein